jgi:ATP-dependent DNA helicase PIF1
LRSRDTFLEVDDPHGHIKKMLQTSVLNTMTKNGIPNHELKLKIGDVCLVLRAIHGLGLANNLRVRIVEIGAHSVEVATIGEIEEQKLRLPRISFKFRLPCGKSYHILRMQYPLRLVYAMTFNKSQSQTLAKVLLNITNPPFTHGQFAMSRVQDSNNICMYLTEEQLVPSEHSRTGFMPTIDVTVFQEVLQLNS